MNVFRSSLCERCDHLREVVSGKGSRFLLCQRARVDPRFPKYPPQPVWSCGGYQPRIADQSPPVEETGPQDGST